MVGQQQSNLHVTTFHFLRSGLRSQSQDCCVVSFQIPSSTAYVSTTMTVKRRCLHFYQHTLTIETTVATSMAVATLNQSVAPTAHVALPKTRPLSASPSVRPESLKLFLTSLSHGPFTFSIVPELFGCGRFSCFAAFGTVANVRYRQY